ncbi:MAG TPA: hypothetical protein VF546_20195 [Pyrinomonadaceae bacterium]|jgi:hypothetical protein
MYRPNFCAECGARVERTRWRWWTSRRFCPNCAPLFRRAAAVKAFAGCGLLLSLGFGAGRALRPAAPPLVVTAGAPVALAPAALPPRAAANPDAPAPAYGPDGTPTERPTEPNEVVSICGARTQKGTPCQRRVRGTGRCWQHLGKPAMLPPEKLIVQKQEAEGRRQ